MPLQDEDSTLERIVPSVLFNCRSPSSVRHRMVLSRCIHHVCTSASVRDATLQPIMNSLKYWWCLWWRYRAATERVLTKAKTKLYNVALMKVRSAPKALNRKP